MEDWDVPDANFSDDEFEQTPLNAAIEKIVIVSEQVLDEMKDHLSRNENTQFDNKLNYLMNRLSQLVILSNAVDNPDATEEEIDALIKDAELRSTEIDYDALFNPDNEKVKHGTDVIDYIDNEKESDDDPFDF